MRCPADAAFFVLWLVLGAGCSTDPVPRSESDAALSSTVCEAGYSESYETFAGPFFLNWCTGCHSSGLPEGERQDAPMGVDFDTLDGIIAHAEEIVLRVHEQGTMPPAGGPSEAERERIAAWVTCGLPEADHGFEPPPPPDAGPEADATPGESCGGALRLPESLELPRCAMETRTCVEGCATRSEDEVDACRDACIEADPTPPQTELFSEVDCGSCTFLSLLECAEQNGCRELTNNVRCCIEECFSSGDPSCFESRCARELESFGLCVYYQADFCLDYDGEYMGACFGP